jgi:hypothetical protein
VKEMDMRLRVLAVLMAFSCTTMPRLSAQDAAPAGAANPKPVYTSEYMLRRIAGENAGAPQNAALVYWMAFAQMKELPVGGSAKDARAALDANTAALTTMARASQIALCDWGLDYSLGPNAPVAHLPKARALARVNSAAATRALSAGRVDEAIDRWLIGMRFARHMESGGTLISTVTAWTALRETWAGIEMPAIDKRFSVEQRARLAEALRALPETVFSWNSAILNEARVLQTAATMAKPGSSPSLPTEGDTKRFLREVERVSEAFKGSPEQAAPAIVGYEKEMDLHPFYRNQMPSLTKVNDTRREVKAARERLLGLLN